MKIKMIAIAPYDGWAFIVKDEQLYLLRPPYQAEDLIEASRQDLSNALHKHGFQETDLAPGSLSDTIRFLKEKYVEVMKDKGMALPGREKLKSLLRHASQDILLEYLEKAEKEFIPKRNLNAAESIALALIPLDTVINNKSMLNRALDIIRVCQEERTKLKEFMLEPVDLKHKFPNAVRRYTKSAIIEEMISIYKNKQLLAVGM